MQGRQEQSIRRFIYYFFKDKNAGNIIYFIYITKLSGILTYDKHYSYTRLKNKN